MTDEETVQKLMNLRLATMAQAFRDLLTEAPGSQLSFSEQVALMVDREWTDRENRRLARLMRAARLSVGGRLPRARLVRSRARPRQGDDPRARHRQVDQEQA